MRLSAQIELRFPVIGQSLPVDHGYLLYSALSGQLPALHREGAAVAIGPISGQWSCNGLLTICPQRSRLRLRLGSEQIATVLPLAGKSLDLGAHKLRLGVPTVHTLVPAPALISRLVTIKKFTEPEPFLAAARRQLDDLQIAADVGIPVLANGPRQGEPRRKVLRIRDKMVIGFALQVTGLTAEESVRLQEDGIGGRRRMGCGFFVPLRPRML